jgi:hypothetical protein
MQPHEELMLIFGALHLIALALGVVLFVMFLRADTTSEWQPPDDEDPGGGGNDRSTDRPKPCPTGGIPLPDAQQAQVRLRPSHGRLADGYPRRERRPAREPRRVPERF